MKSTRLIALFVLSSSLLPRFSAAADPRLFIMGIWPNRLRLLDEATETFVGEIPLRYGAVTSYGETAHTPDFRKLYYVTDRMEAVEIVDPVKRAVVDEVRISTPVRRVRIFNVFPGPEGKRLYLRVSAVELGTDRFEADDFDLITYDVEAHEVKDSYRLPRETSGGNFEPIYVSADGQTLFVLGKDIYQLRASDRAILDKIPLAQPVAAGYGPLQPAGLFEAEPEVFYGLYGTIDPVMKKQMSGVVRIDLPRRDVSSFELGPAIRANVFVLSADGKYAYAGPRDLVKIDMTTRRIVAMKKDFEQGRTNNTLILSSDGKKLYVTGVGNRLQVVDSSTLEEIGSIPAGGDIMSPALALPAR
jgi:hypothetical protein